MEEIKEMLSITINEEDGKEKTYSIDKENDEYIFTCEYDSKNDVTEYDMTKKSKEEYEQLMEELRSILAKW